MEVSNCRGCGRLFNVVTNTRLCPACVNRQEEKFQEVKAFINENTYANIDTISKECDVSIKQLKEWVRQERLIFTEGSPDGIECEQCGGKIRTGRFCDACRTKLANGFQGVIERPQKENKKKLTEKDRMRFLQNL